MNDENMRLKEWQDLMEKYNEFFYADDGIYTVSLFDKELEQYNLDFDYVKGLIKKLKDFEKKYGNLYKDEIENLQKYKQKLLELDTGTNGIKNIYDKMNNMYYFIEDY